MDLVLLSFEKFIKELSHDNFEKKPDFFEKKSSEFIERVILDLENEKMQFQNITIKNNKRTIKKKQIEFKELPDLYETHSYLLTVIREYFLIN